MRETLLQIGQNYAFARKENFSQHPLSNLIRRQLKDHIKQALGDMASKFIICASSGTGTWAHVPWVAVFDPMVTEKATEGYYVVYLFASDKGEIHLSLNQGTTSVMEEFRTKGPKVLRDRATFMSTRVADFASYFDTYTLDLGYKATLPKGYEAGHAFGRMYQVDSLPNEEFLRADLHQMMKAYLALTFRGGLDSSAEGSNDEAPSSATITEVRRYRMHQRIDRHPKASKEAKSYHGTVCQACCFDFANQYGELGSGFIEAHHLRPLSTLEEDIPFQYNIATDFAVLCSNCHRMIHRTPDPSDLVSFRRLISQGC